MLARTPNQSTQYKNIPPHKSRLLLVSDTPEGITKLTAGLDRSRFDIRTASTMPELRAACRRIHDVVVIHAASWQVPEILKIIRGSKRLTEVPVYVESTRIETDLKLAGVLPRFRAMPCRHAELLLLLHRSNGTGVQVAPKPRLGIL